MFYSFLAVSGEHRCPAVTRTFYQGSQKTTANAFWNIECSSGPSYVSEIFSDEKGSSKIMTCGELRALGAVHGG
jgi:hypothetical protein